MKHFFSFLSVFISFCIFLYGLPAVPASAQQHNSFTSAQLLSIDRSVSVSIPAYDSLYFYFYPSKWQNTTVSDYQIILSDLSSVIISLYDDQGAAWKLSTSISGKNRCVTCSGISNNSKRYFLVLHNKTKQDMQTKLSIHPVTTPLTDSGNEKKSDAKTAPTPDKSKKKATPKNTKSGSSAKTKSKTKKAQNSTSAKPKTTANPKQTMLPKSAKASPAYRTPTPNPAIRGQNASGSKTVSPTPDKPVAKSSLPSSSPDQIPANPTATPSSRSFLNLSTHFYRMSAGYSIAITELLQLEQYAGQKITCESLTPECILLQNDIIYAKSSGLAVIKIISPTGITSCTIYIQETLS